MLPSNPDLFKLIVKSSVFPPKRTFLCCCTNAIHKTNRLILRGQRCEEVKQRRMTPSQRKDHQLTWVKASGLWRIHWNRRFDSLFYMEWDSYRYWTDKSWDSWHFIRHLYKKTWELPGWTKTTQKNLKEPQSFLIIKSVFVFPIWWFPSPKRKVIG